MSKPQSTVLKNGLTVISQHVPGEQVYANIAVNAGFRHERPEQNHMTHYLEHMAAGENEFLNTQERETYIQNRRGMMNASTNTELTDYWLQFGKEHAEDAVKLLADGFLHPKFDDKNVDVERKAVATEINSHAHDGNWINIQNLLEASFPATQIDKGWAKVDNDVLLNHTTEALKAFKAIHYTGDNMAIAVVGDVKHEDVIAWAEKHFEGLEATPEAERTAPPPAVYRGGMRTHVNEEAVENKISIAFEGSGRKDPEALATDQIVASILGGSTSSRLYKALVDESDLVSSVYSDCGFGFRDNGLLRIDAATTSGQARETIGIIAQEAQKLASTVTQDELDKVKNQIIGSAERGVENIQSIGGVLAFTQAVDGKLYDLDEDVAVLKSVTLEQVKTRAAEIFKSPPSVAVHGNELEKLPGYEEISAAFGAERHLDDNGLVIQTEQEKTEALARATAPGKEPALPEVTAPTGTQPDTAAQENAKPQVTELENGMKIITQKMPTKQISAQLRVGAGNRHEGYDQTSIADIVCETSDAASERLNTAQKSEAVANMRGASSSSTELESTSFSIRAANEFTDDALQILAENVTSPKFDVEGVEKQKTLVKKDLMGSKLDPQANTRSQMRRVAFPESGMDKDPLGAADQIGGLTHETIDAFRDQHYTADNMILSVVGDVDHEAIVAQAKALFSNVKAHPDQPREPMPQAEYRGGMETKNSDASDQLTLRIGFESHDNSDSKANATDALLATILGGGFSSRLMSSLRSDKGLVYYAQAMDSPMPDAGLFTIVTGANPDKLEETIDAIAVEVTRFADTVTQEELDAVKNDQLGDYERAMSSPSTVAGALAGRLARGQVFDVQESIQNTKDVTLEDVKARAREIFSSAPSVAAYGKGADLMMPYEELSEKFGQRRSVDDKGLVVQDAPAQEKESANWVKRVSPTNDNPREQQNGVASDGGRGF